MEGKEMEVDERRWKGIEVKGMEGMEGDRGEWKGWKGNGKE